MNPKIFLIQPKVPGGFKTPPLGLQLIATILRQKGHTQIFDIDPNKGDNPYQIDYTGPNVVVGMSITFMTISEGFILAEFIKSRNPGAVIIFGGPQPTLMPDESICSKNVDIVAIGEGLHTIPEILERKRDGKSLKGVKGIWYKDEKGWVTKTEERDFIQDLDTIPFADRSFFNERLYRKHQNALLEKIVIPTTWHLMTAQGCPFNCNMCQPALRTISGPWRQRSVENVISEIRLLKETYGAKRFSFNDNDMGISRSWMKDFCREVRNIDAITMSCLGRANLLDFELLKLMKECGFDTISFGAESGSNSVLAGIMNKKTTVQNIIDFADNCYKLKLAACAYWIIANPGETVEEMKQTARLAATLPLFYSHFHIATPNPGTRYFTDALNGGYLNLASWDAVHDRNNPTIIKEGVAAKDIAAVDAYLIRSMLEKGWNYKYNGHTLSFVNTKLFAKRYPIKVFGNEINMLLHDFKPYHFRNLALGFRSIFQRSDKEGGQG